MITDWPTSTQKSGCLCGIEMIDGGIGYDRQARIKSLWRYSLAKPVILCPRSSRTVEEGQVLLSSLVRDRIKKPVT